MIWGLVALSYNSELAEGKRRVEETNEALTEAKQGLEKANGKLGKLNGELTASNAKLDDAFKLAHNQEDLARRYIPLRHPDEPGTAGL